MNDKVNSAADPAFDHSEDQIDRDVDFKWPVAVYGATPKINTVAYPADEAPEPNSGSQAVNTVKSVNLQDNDESRMNSAA